MMCNWGTHHFLNPLQHAMFTRPTSWCSHMTLSRPNTIYNLELWLLLLILRKEFIICWVFHQIKTRTINSNHFYGSVCMCHGLPEQYHMVYAAYPHRNRFTFGTFVCGGFVAFKQQSNTPQRVDGSYIKYAAWFNWTRNDWSFHRSFIYLCRNHCSTQT